jgi:hypothetical protein
MRRKVTVVLYLLVLSTLFSSTQGEEIDNMALSDPLEYSVSAFNLSSSVYWWSESSGLLAWSIPTLPSTLRIEPLDNCTYDNSYFSIIIGNLSLTNASDADITSNLILGDYLLPNFGGIITSPEWDVVEQAFQEMELVASFSNNERIINDITIQTWDVEFEHGSQRTSLSYSREEGILLYANTSFSNYHLTFTLSSFTEGLFSSSELAPVLNYLLVLTIVFSLTFLARKKQP